MKARSIAICIACLLYAVPCAFGEGKKVVKGDEWLKFSDEKKVKAVSSFITSGASHGVTIKKDPDFYCAKLEDFYTKHSDLSAEPFGKILKTLIVMEYDWQAKGVDKDALAKQWLGEELYRANKERLKLQGA